MDNICLWEVVVMRSTGVVPEANQSVCWVTRVFVDVVTLQRQSLYMPSTAGSEVQTMHMAVLTTSCSTF